MKVIGIVNSQGDYEGRKYHNLVFHVSYENENENKDVLGVLTDTVKLRYADLNNLFNIGLADPADVEKLKASDFDEWLGAEIEVSYNKFGAVQGVKKIKPNSDTKQGGAPVSK